MKRITCLTDLSNDLFLDIFDYLDIFDLFQAFFNLNQRLNLLILDQHNCFQANMISIKDEQEFFVYKTILLPKIGFYIRYLSISDRMNYFQIILRSISLKNLVSIRLYDVKLNDLKLLLEQTKLKYLFVQTKFIQNEKHLEEIFRILFRQQSDLCAMQCQFHTKLYFVDIQERFCQLRRIILDDECFSSDFIVLISQLPKLRHINARINDLNRESMEKDLDHFQGSNSLRSIELHIKNVEYDRLLLIFSLMSNVRIVELNGQIDFDIHYILELERNYTSFRCNLQHSVIY